MERTYDELFVYDPLYALPADHLPVVTPGYRLQHRLKNST